MAVSLSNLPGIISGLPLADIEAAINDPSNLGKVAAVVEDIIVTVEPGLPGAAIDALIELFVALVYSQGGGTISPDPDPEHDAQTTQGRGGRNG
jgi:hypothetical protein